MQPGRKKHFAVRGGGPKKNVRLAGLGASAEAHLPAEKMECLKSDVVGVDFTKKSTAFQLGWWENFRMFPLSRCRGKYKIKQRYVHFFFLNEFLHLLAIIGIVKLPEDSCWLYVFTFSGVLHHYAGRALLYMTFYVAFFVLVALSVFLRRLCRPARRLDVSRPRHPLPSFRTFTHTTRDGLKLMVLLLVFGLNLIKHTTCLSGACE